jgi:hypothetical protein
MSSKTINLINRTMNLSLNKCISCHRLGLLAVCLAVMAIAGTGCHLGQPGSASFATVVIQQRSPEEIQAAAVQVFQEDGYTANATGPGQLLFEKEGSRANNLAYNGVVGTHYGAQTLVRVKTEIVDLGGGAHRLQCQAYMVKNAGESFFEDESRLSNLRSGPYQNLLDKVASRLKQP